MPLTFNPAHIRIGVIGLGYVGLPLAVAFARKYPVVGFDIKQSRIEELKRGEDSTREVDPADLHSVGRGFTAPSNAQSTAPITAPTASKDPGAVDTRPTPAHDPVGRSFSAPTAPSPAPSIGLITTTHPGAVDSRPTPAHDPVGRSFSGPTTPSPGRSTGPITSTNPGAVDSRPTSPGLHLTSTASDLAACNVFIVTVPTPIDRYKRPDLGPLLRASETVGKVLKPGDVVIYESTVYPGATEEDCVPVLEKHSGLKFFSSPPQRVGVPPQAPEWSSANSPTQRGEVAAQQPGWSDISNTGDNEGFYAGYSPERINPGDREHRLTAIKKVTSGSTPEAADFIDQLYASIVTAGTHRASSIKVAEAAKVIENTQRDVNIALINELALICNRIGIDTQEVLAAAGTKWNFLPFRPGLVGGHCIGVDPYYLTHKAQELGYHPEVILAGRRINDNMGFYVAAQVVKLMAQKGIAIAGSRILVMGLAFKDNCPDVRNTRVVDIVTELASYKARIEVYDPWVNPEESRHEYGIAPVAEPKPAHYDAIVIAVGHRQFADMGSSRIHALGKPNHVLYDVKHLLPAQDSDARI